MSLDPTFRCGALLVAGSFFVSPNAFGEIDPRKEAEKQEKEARPVLEGEEGEDHTEFHRRLAMEGEKTLEEIQKLLDEIQKNLSDKQTSAGTQSKQKAAVERMDELIKKLGKGCSQCSGGSGNGNSKKQTSGDPRQEENQKQRAEDEKKSEAQKRKERQQKMQAQQPKPEEKEKKDGKVENDRTADAKPPDAKTGRLNNALRESARWGLLPPKLAEEVLMSTGKEAPPEYREIISRYYKRLNDQYQRERK